MIQHTVEMLVFHRLKYDKKRAKSNENLHMQLMIVGWSNLKPNLLYAVAANYNI